jgi:hypothetical protein
MERMCGEVYDMAIIAPVMANHAPRCDGIATFVADS